MRRLRIAQVTVQPVLVWDDGEELTPGPQLNPVTGPLSMLAQMAERLPAEVAQLAEQLMSTVVEKCPDCEVAVGEPHDGGCDIARCPDGTQRITCYQEHDHGKAIWTGDPDAEIKAAQPE